MGFDLEGEKRRGRWEAKELGLRKSEGIQGLEAAVAGKKCKKVLEGTWGCCVALSEALAGLQLVDLKIFLNTKSSNCIFAPSHCYKFPFFLPASFLPSFLSSLRLPSFFPPSLSFSPSLLGILWEEKCGWHSPLLLYSRHDLEYLQYLPPNVSQYLPPPDPDTLGAQFSRPLGLPFFWSCLPKPKMTRTNILLAPRLVTPVDGRH